MKLTAKSEMSSSTVAAPFAEDFQKIIAGGWSVDSQDGDWRLPSKQILIFVSSTFTDTHLERNILAETILPNLQTLARKANMTVTLTDMRYGVRDDNSLKHRTWDCCKDELERCWRDSAGIFFLSLQGDKYGYRPIPRTFPKAVIDEVLIKLQETPGAISEVDRSVFQKWYVVDENALPAQYVLRSLQNLNDDEFWGTVLPTMRRVFTGVLFDPSDETLLVGKSVTEWEFRYACKLANKRELARTLYTGPISHAEDIVWLEREFVEGVTKLIDTKWNIADSYTDADVRSRIEALKQYMTSQLSNSSDQHHGAKHLKIDCPSLQKYVQVVVDKNANVDFADYVEAWRSMAEERLSHEVRMAMDHLVAVQRHQGLTPDLDEILHHCRWAADKCKSFFGREQLVAQILQRIVSVTLSAEVPSGPKPDDIATLPTKRTLKPSKPPPPPPVSFALVGASGCGKTALLSRVAQLLYLQQDSFGSAADESSSRDSNGATLIRRPVIVRFCGTSSGSSDALSLMLSIMRQIQLIYTVESVQQDVTSKSPYPQVVAEFHRVMAKYPVVLCLDSLDQLSDAYDGRSQLSFLDGLVPHPRSAIVATTLPDDVSDLQRVYGCETRLSQWKVSFILVSDLSAPSNLSSGTVDQNADSALVATEYEYASVLRSILQQQHQRTCNPVQWEYIMRQAGVEPTPLYLQLAVRVIRFWQSDDAVVDSAHDENVTGKVLAAGVKPLLVQIFDSLEAEFGVIVTRAALGFITFAKDGVNDNEMQDLLTIHAKVIADVDQFKTLGTVQRLPFHVWARIRSALSGLIMEQQNGCLRWYHRQLQETAVLRYQRDEEVEIRTVFLRYFGNLLLPSERETNLVSAQYLVWSVGDSDDRMSASSIHQVDSNRDDFAGVWYADSSLNVRRCQELSSHLSVGLSSLPLLTQQALIQSICCPEYLCACARTGRLVALVDHLRDCLVSQGTSLEPTSLQRIRDYVSFLRQYASSIVLDPVTQIPWAMSQMALVGHNVTIHHDAAAFGFDTGRRSCDGASSPWLYPTKFSCSQSPPTFPTPDLVLVGCKDDICAVAGSPVSPLLVVLYCKGKVEVWDLTRGVITTHFTLTIGFIVKGFVLFTPDGTRVLIDCPNAKYMEVWDVTIGQHVCKVPCDLANDVFDVHISHDSQWICAVERGLSSQMKCTVSIYSLSTGERMETRECLSTPTEAPGKGTVPIGVSGARHLRNNEAWLQLKQEQKSRSRLNVVKCKCSFRDRRTASSVDETSDPILLVAMLLTSSNSSYHSQSDDSGKNVLLLWNFDKMTTLSFEGPRYSPPPTMLFSRDNRQLSLAWGYEIEIWDTLLGICNTRIHCECARIEYLRFTSEHTKRPSAIPEDLLLTLRANNIIAWNPRTGEFVAGWPVKGKDHFTVVSATRRTVEERNVQGSTPQFVVNAASDNTLQVWSTSLLDSCGKDQPFVQKWGKELQVFKDTILNAVLSPWLDPFVVQETSVATETPLASIGSGVPMCSGRYLAVSGSDRAVNVWDTCTGQLLSTLQCAEHTGTLSSICFVPRLPSSLVAYETAKLHVMTASSDGLLCLWDVRTSQLLHVLTGHTDRIAQLSSFHISISYGSDAIQSIASNPAQEMMLLAASISRDQTLRIWDVDHTRCLAIQTLSDHRGGCCLAHAAQRAWLATADQAGLTIIWQVSIQTSNTNDGEHSAILIKYCHLQCSTRESITHLAFSHDAAAKHLAVLTGHRVFVFDTSNPGVLLCQFEAPYPHNARFHTDSCDQLFIATYKDGMRWVDLTVPADLATEANEPVTELTATTASSAVSNKPLLTMKEIEYQSQVFVEAKPSMSYPDAHICSPLTDGHLHSPVPSTTIVLDVTGGNIALLRGNAFAKKASRSSKEDEGKDTKDIPLALQPAKMTFRVGYFRTKPATLLTSKQQTEYSLTGFSDSSDDDVGSGYQQRQEMSPGSDGRTTLKISDVERYNRSCVFLEPSSPLLSVHSVDHISLHPRGNYLVTCASGTEEELEKRGTSYTAQKRYSTTRGDSALGAVVWIRHFPSLEHCFAFRIPDSHRQRITYLSFSGMGDHLLIGFEQGVFEVWTVVWSDDSTNKATITSVRCLYVQTASEMIRAVEQNGYDSDIEDEPVSLLHLYHIPPDRQQDDSAGVTIDNDSAASPKSLLRMLVLVKRNVLSEVWDLDTRSVVGSGSSYSSLMGEASPVACHFLYHPSPSAPIASSDMVAVEGGDMDEAALRRSKDVLISRKDDGVALLMHRRFITPSSSFVPSRVNLSATAKDTNTHVSGEIASANEPSLQPAPASESVPASEGKTNISYQTRALAEVVDRRQRFQCDSFCVSADGKYLVASMWNYINHAMTCVTRLFDVHVLNAEYIDRALAKPLQQQPDQQPTSTTGAQVVVSSNPAVSQETHACLWTSDFPGGKQLEISPDERFLWCFHDTAVSLMSLRDGSELHELKVGEQSFLRAWLLTSTLALVVYKSSISVILVRQTNATDTSSSSSDDKQTLTSTATTTGNIADKYKLHLVANAPIYDHKITSFTFSPFTLDIVCTLRGQDVFASSFCCIHGLRGYVSSTSDHGADVQMRPEDQIRLVAQTLCTWSYVRRGRDD